MTDNSKINWYPGHMRKTERQIAKDLSLVDAVIEILDARLPLSSKNPDMERITRSKPRVILFNKIDAADMAQTSKWAEYYKKQGYKCVYTDSRSGRGVDKAIASVRELLSDKIKSRAERGMSGRALRILIVGIPNVGKSSFINRLAGARKAAVEDRPGVTRENRWITLKDNTELMDSPGILWPRQNAETARRLAYSGAITDRITDTQELAVGLLSFLRENYLPLLTARYSVTAEDAYGLLIEIGRKRGCILKGGEVDTLRAAELVLDDFRGGRIGKITLDIM